MTFEVHANRKPWRFATEAEARAAAAGIVEEVTAAADAVRALRALRALRAARREALAIKDQED
jgi:hypothetical protein